MPTDNQVENSARFCYRFNPEISLEEHRIRARQRFESLEKALAEQEDKLMKAVIRGKQAT